MAADDRQSGRLVAETLPHEYRPKGLEFEVESFRLDGGEARQPEGQALSLVGEPDWDEVTVAFTLRAPPDVCHTVFPPGERLAPPGRLIVAGWSRAAINRHRVVVTDSVEPGHTYEGTFTLERDRFRGTVNFQPYLVRASDGPDDDTYASRAGQRVADGPMYTVRVDEDSSGDDVLRPIFESFEARDDFPPSAEHLHYLDLRDADDPRLYLNADHDEVVDVLRTEQPGTEARVRDLVFDTIEADVWPQLVVQIGVDVEEDGEIPHEWERDVLEELGDELYPDADSRQEMALQLHDDVSDPDGTRALITDVSRAVQQRIDLPDSTYSLLADVVEDDS